MQYRPCAWSVDWLSLNYRSFASYIYLKACFTKKMLFWKLFSANTSWRMYSTIFCHQTCYSSELFEKFEEVVCGRVLKPHKHGIGWLRHVFYARINTGSGQKASVIVARINTGSGRNQLMKQWRSWKSPGGRGTCPSGSRMSLHPWRSH